MSCETRRENPQDLHGPWWHDEAKTPVVDGKYIDPKTGEVLIATGHQEYRGPPAVDIIIKSIHADTCQCVLRAAVPFPMESLLCQIARVVADQKLALDSLTATTYSIRVILAHELTPEEFHKIAAEMAWGNWERR